LVEAKVNNPINPGNRKVIIFTAFSDTARYLYDQLSGSLKQQGLECGLITGSDRPQCTLGKGYDFQQLLTLFSPLSKEKALVMPDAKGNVDVIIATDCISEGQNLQDCDFLVNYDIHWNPVRIIQRFGRIDRIGSKNKVIQLVNYWPDISLDEYINLKERVESRMVLVDVTATGDDNVLSAQAGDVAYRREQLRRLKEEVVELEELRTGVSITDLGLNDFRMELLDYARKHPELEGLPNGMHAVVPARPDLGLEPGVLFCLRNRHPGVNVDQQNRLHPYYMVYIGMDGQVRAGHTQAKAQLDLLRAVCHDQTQPVESVCKPFNRETRDGAYMGRYSALLDQAIRTMVSVKEEKDLDTLFSAGPTTALENVIAGLKDFELVAFVVAYPQVQA